MRTDEERLTLAKALNVGTIPAEGLTIEGHQLKVKTEHGVKVVTIRDPRRRNYAGLGMRSDIVGTGRSLDAIYRWLEEMDRRTAKPDEESD